MYLLVGECGIQPFLWNQCAFLAALVWGTLPAQILFYSCNFVQLAFDQICWALTANLNTCFSCRLWRSAVISCVGTVQFPAPRVSVSCGDPRIKSLDALSAVWTLKMADGGSDWIYFFHPKLNVRMMTHLSVHKVYIASWSGKYRNLIKTSHCF